MPKADFTILVGQNQTIRMRDGLKPVNLFTPGLESRVAVVISNGRNFSLTHCDTQTDPEFIMREVAELIKRGDFTIDIIAVDDPQNLAQLPAELLQFVEKTYPKVTNSKGKKEVRTIKFDPSFQKGVWVELKEGGGFNLKATTLTELVNLGNDVMATKDMQKITYEQQIAAFFSKSVGKRFPGISYDEGKFFEVDTQIEHDAVQKFLKEARDPKNLMAQCVKLHEMQEASAENLENYTRVLPALLQKYFALIKDAPKPEVEKKAAAAEKSPAKPKRYLLHAAQGETVRFYNKKMFDCDIGTLGIDSCVAVIIRDENGNVSLSHIDATGDLSFIEREVKEFVKGNFTIDVCAIESSSEYAKEVLKHVQKNYPQIKNLRGDSDLIGLNFQNGRETNVVFHRNEEVKIVELDGDRLDAAYNFMDDGTFNQRRADQTVRQFFKYIDKAMPRVINKPDGNPIPYDSSFLQRPEIEEFLKKVKPLMKLKDKSLFRAEIAKLAEKNGDDITQLPHSLNYMEIFPETLQRYFDGVPTTKIAANSAAAHKTKDPDKSATQS